MPIRPYGVFKGSIIDRRLGSGGNPHYQVHIVDEETHWCLAINVESQLQPSEVEYYVADPFAHPIVDRIKDLKLGFHELESKPDSGALLDRRDQIGDDLRARLRTEIAFAVDTETHRVGFHVTVSDDSTRV